MNVRDSTGSCALCGVDLGPTEMTKHLAGCIEEYRYDVGRDDERQERGYHIAFQATRAPVFWVHLMARPDATLAQLDAFLRDLWMEDRSKQSRFVLGTKVFSSNPTTDVTPSNLQGDLSVELQEVLEDEIPFEYAYDFQQTTELEGRVIAKKSVLPDQAQTPVRMLARNNLPEIPCQCGGAATLMCRRCAGGPEAWLCASCLAEHPCEDEQIVEIENTPRALVDV